MSLTDQALDRNPSRSEDSASYSQTTVQEHPDQAVAESAAQTAEPQAATEVRRETGAQINPRKPKENNMEDFATVLENFEAEQTESLADEHKVIAGTVLKLTDKHVVVDIGAKSEGLVPIAQVLDHEGKPRFQAGDAIPVLVEHGESEEGYPRLSYEKAQRTAAWDTIEKAYNDKGSVTGRVVDRVKGGVSVDLGGAVAFLPGSQVDIRPAHNLDALKGQPIEVRVIKLNKKRGNVVVSRKAILDEQVAEQRGKTLDKLAEGAVLTGTVKNLTDYGAFVELEQGIEGLVHVSEMTWSKRMKHPSKIVKVNDQVETVVLNVNPGDRRISLGLKQLETNPWDSLQNKYPVGATVEGRVRNLTEFGAFVEIEDGIDGLVHVSNMSWTKRVKHPSEVLKKGDKVKAVVLAIEPANRRLSLGMKQLQPNAWQNFFDTHKVGDVVHGKVLRTAQFGAFVEISEGIEALCHNSEAVDEAGAPRKLQPGEEHEFKIVKMNPEETNS